MMHKSISICSTQPFSLCITESLLLHKKNRSMNEHVRFIISVLSCYLRCRIYIVIIIVVIIGIISGDSIVRIGC